MALINVFATWTLLLVLFATCRCIKLKSIHVPYLVNPGDDVKLNCSFDLQGSQLYSIKWYKDDEEFYRYIPKLTPKKTRFQNKGINVDLRSSKEGNVVLQSVNFDSTGVYRCEASGEKPHFQTIRNHSMMIVHVLPSSGPTITGAINDYTIGDPIRLNCTSSPSKPAANITWFINGVEITNKHNTNYDSNSYKTGIDAVKTFVLHDDVDGLELTVSILNLALSSSTFQRNRVEITCDAKILNVFNSFDSVVYQSSAGGDASAITNRGGNGASSNRLINVNLTFRTIILYLLVIVSCVTTAV